MATELPYLIRKLQESGAFFANENLKTLRDAFDDFVASAGVTVQHNDGSPVVRNILDFLDGAAASLGIPGITFTVTDDSANGRVKITPVLTAPTARLLTHDLRTTDLTVSATAAASADNIVTSTSKTYDGSTPVRITFFTRRGFVGADTDVLRIVLYRDSTLILSPWGVWTVNNASNVVQPAGSPGYLVYRETPSAGSHTYSAKAYVTTSSPGTPTGEVDGGAAGGGAAPAFIRVEYDI